MEIAALSGAFVAIAFFICMGMINSRVGRSAIATERLVAEIQQLKLLAGEADLANRQLATLTEELRALRFEIAAIQPQNSTEIQ